jgi:hypothetical protein
MIFPENLPALSDSLWLETPLASKNQELEAFGPLPWAERNSNPENKVTIVIRKKDENIRTIARRFFFMVIHHRVLIE